MPFFNQQRLIAVALTSLCAVLTACSSEPDRIHVQPARGVPVTVTTKPPVVSRTLADVLADAARAETLRKAQVLIAEERQQIAEAAGRSAGNARSNNRARPSADGVTVPAVSASRADIMALPTSGDYHAWPDWRLWHAVGLCEQRGDTEDGIAWHGSPAGGLPGSGYPGGLGLSRDFWRIFAPQAGVTQTNGALASPGEQIRVALAGSHNGTRMGGWSSWGSGCIKRTMASLP